MSLTSRLQALLTFSNETTGKEDTTLGAAVKSLADGYGQGGGIKSISGELTFEDDTTANDYNIETGYTEDMGKLLSFSISCEELGTTPVTGCFISGYYVSGNIAPNWLNNSCSNYNMRASSSSSATNNTFAGGFSYNNGVFTLKSSYTRKYMAGYSYKWVLYYI